ncbi:MAG: hypothetical protein HC942_23450 [Microcoleus sp. SU_5_6]|nr:hypothetical protein [Microcoleus sp. SU_5_6]
MIKVEFGFFTVGDVKTRSAIAARKTRAIDAKIAVLTVSGSGKRLETAF